MIKNEVGYFGIYGLALKKLIKLYLGIYKGINEKRRCDWATL